MQHNITTAKASQLPEPGAEPTRSWPLSVQKLNASMIGDFLTAEIPAPISETDARWISGRTSQLEAWRAPGPNDRGHILQALGVLFTTYGGAAISEDVAATRIKTYVEALSDRPAWAIKRAAERWIRGDVTGIERKQLDFPPSPARLRELATECMRPVNLELAALQKLTRAKVVKPIDPEERRRTIERLTRNGVVVPTEWPPAATATAA